MTERLPNTDEDNWADILGANDGTGGFLRVSHNDDGTFRWGQSIDATSADGSLNVSRSALHSGDSGLLSLSMGVDGADDLLSLASRNANRPIRFPGFDAWFVLSSPNTAPTASDLKSGECVIWFDAGGPTINFLAQSGETAQIVLT